MSNPGGKNLRFPLPAPATIIRGPFICNTASSGAHLIRLSNRAWLQINELDSQLGIRYSLSVTSKAQTMEMVANICREY
jgi:hypothetical protein